MKNRVLREAPNDEVLQEDLEFISKSEINLKDLTNSTILVTGATGLIGSLIIKSLACCNRLENSNIRIIALARNEQKVNSMYESMIGNNNFKIIYSDISTYLDIDENIDYIIHGASPTTSKYFVNSPIKTIETIVLGTKKILELAKNKNVRGFVYLSTMEVYGVTDPKLERISEDDLGYIDILSVRSSYSESKRLAETLCASYEKEYGVPIKIARLAQCFGAGISFEESRLFGEIARCVINNTDIILHTDAESIGNYCYVREAIIGILLLLTKGKSGEAYNINNEESTISIKDMVNMVVDKIANNKIKLAFDISKTNLTHGYPPNTNMKLSSRKISNLGWKAEIGLEETYERMIKSMKANNNG